MTLYHGTTLHAWKQISKDGFLQVASTQNSPYYDQGSKATEYGYVYLVGNVIDAVEYASSAWSALNEGGHLSGRLLIVIAVDLPADEIEIDPEDGRTKPTIYAQGPYLRIHRNVSLDNVVKIAAFQYNNDDAVCKDIIKWRDNPQKVEDIIWLAPECRILQWNGTGSYY